MTVVQLRLLSHPPPIPNPPLHADTPTMKLWQLARDDTIHLILREPSLLELARRRDSELLPFCEKTLLASGNTEDWFVACKTIAAIGTKNAIDKLIMLYARSISDDRSFIIKMVAQTLTAEHIRPFSIMVRELTTTGELDISGWTKTAIATLLDVCKRQNIEVVFSGIKNYGDDLKQHVDYDFLPESTKNRYTT